MADLGGAPALPQPSDALVRDGGAPLAQAGYACDSRRTVVGSAQHDAAADRRPKRRRQLSVKDVGRTGMAESTRRKPILSALAFNAALLCAFFSAMLSVTTYVPAAERSGLSWSCGLAAMAVGLVGLGWSRMPGGLRFLGVGVVLLAALGGLYAASRLLG
jgi:hypothetical protein